MKLNIRIPKTLKPYFTKELKHFQLAYAKGDLQAAWQHLERAHIIGQSYPYTHTLAHWEMLKFACKIKSRKEIIGQIPRLIVGGIKSFVGVIPIGNPGGANVAPLKSFPIEKDMQAIFTKAGIKIHGS